MTKRERLAFRNEVRMTWLRECNPFTSSSRAETFVEWFLGSGRKDFRRCLDQAVRKAGVRL